MMLVRVAVLVVGTGQSGCQIAEELYQRGRKVYLCVGGAPRIPRFYRGKDTISWLKATGFFDHTVESLPSSKARFGANPFVSGRDGGRSLNLHQFARDGVHLLGRLEDAQDNKIRLSQDLKERLIKVDNFVAELKKGIDEYIEEHNIEAEAASTQGELLDGYDTEIIEELDLEKKECFHNNH